MQIEYINIFLEEKAIFSLTWIFLKPLRNVERFTKHKSPINEIH